MAGLSNYPAVLDTRAASGTNIRPVINFADRADTDAATLYTLLAADITVLQDAVMSIEAELGVDPSSTDATVAIRIATILGTTTADLRYGGANWVANGSPTIQNHNHTTNQINLTTDVTGKIPVSNIALASGDTGPMTGDDIRISSGSAVYISAALNNKLDTTGGTLTGGLVIGGSLATIQLIDIDAKDTSYVVGGNVADVDESYSDSARQGTITTVGGVLLSHSQELRYFDYSCSIRCKVSDIAPTPTGTIGILTILSGEATALTYNITPEIFDVADTYQILHFPFIHTSDGSATQRDVTITIDWYGDDHPVADIDSTLTIDSYIISPINNAAYWKLT